MSDTSSTSSGIGLGSLLFVAFLVLKLCHVFDWSWVWVFAPLWIPAALVVLLLSIAAIIAGITSG